MAPSGTPTEADSLGDSQSPPAGTALPSEALANDDGSVTAAPTQIPSGVTELPLDGFLPTLVSWPQAARWPQPVLVAAHGAGDSAEYQCEFWRQLLGQRGVIVCLRGRALRKGSPDHGYYFPDHLALEREFLAALARLAERYPELADARRIVYTGYSQGAQMGLLMLVAHGALAPRLLLIEGGSGDWTTQRAAQFAKSGGERVEILCGTPGCYENAERSAGVLRARGLQATARHVPGGGHTYAGAMAPEDLQAFAELTLGDDRWKLTLDDPRAQP